VVLILGIWKKLDNKVLGMDDLMGLVVVVDKRSVQKEAPLQGRGILKSCERSSKPIIVNVSPWMSSPKSLGRSRRQRHLQRLVAYNSI
jgi:hypothetical protein